VNTLDKPLRFGHYLGGMGRLRIDNEDMAFTLGGLSQSKTSDINRLNSESFKNDFK